MPPGTRLHRFFLLAALPLALLASACACAQSPPPTGAAFDPARADVAGFIAEVAQRQGFEPGALASVLAQAESKPQILAAISRPAERALNWDEYRGRFLIERRIRRGAAVYAERRTELERASAASGVPADVLLGIVGVETFYGENTGKHRVVDALATLAFDYPPRAPFFRGELEQFLLMTREEKVDPLVPLGSYAGAMGIPQFMPTSFRTWAVDGDGDGTRDLWGDWADVFASVGNYLKAHGWQGGQPVMTPADVTGANLAGLTIDKIALDQTVGSLRARGIRFETALPADAPAMLVALSVGFGVEYRIGFQNFYSITRYNRSYMYASAVSDLADAIAAARAVSTAPPAQTPPVESSPAAPAETQAARASLAANY